MQKVKEKLAKMIAEALDVPVEASVFTVAPNEKMGDLALPCFNFAKELGRDPVELAGSLKKKLGAEELSDLDSVEATGPYLNFKLKDEALMRLLNEEIIDHKQFGQGKNKGKIMVEFAHPNTHKPVHIGHIRNMITGESLCRILENAGHNIIRANYQGDVGMHIAKALWGIEKLKTEYDKVKKESLEKRIAFLGRAYAHGGQAFEKDEAVQEEVKKYNDKIYNQDKSIKDIYQTTRKWSLEYFEAIYQRLDTRFDRFYFESEFAESGKQIVAKFLKKGVFKESEGAIIFEGEKHGLHTRVFINSKGFPVYEAKDLALAEMQFTEFKPEKIIHVVGKEQREYFQVVFKAMEETLPESKGKQVHLAYGWVSLKEGKMSSRTGQVVLGEWLLNEVEKKITEVMKDSKVKDQKEISQKVALAAVKYSMLKPGVTVDMKFDLDESVSLSGDSGPYLLYICARIKSIFKKAQGTRHKAQRKIQDSRFKTQELDSYEKSLIKKLAEYEEVTAKAAQTLDPSQMARYLFELAQSFNNFYHECPVLQAPEEVKAFRLRLIRGVEQIMEKGLNLLGIELVEEM